MTRILVTGATGYIGNAFTHYALAQGADLMALVRRKPDIALPCPFMIPNDWDNEALLAKSMEGRDAVIHCAGLAHNKKGDVWETNLELTVTLAKAAVKAGAKRFVFISSAAVFGEGGHHKLADEPFPTTEYGHSKREAETACLALCAGTETKLSIIRPPVIVGKGSPGRPATLRALGKAGLLLPLGALTAQRSSITIDNLTRILWQEAIDTGPSALVHASDASLTVTDLIRSIMAADDMNPLLLPVPAPLFAILGKIPVLSTQIEPLIQTHILEAGRIAL